MSDTTGWKRIHGGLYRKDLPNCRIEVIKQSGAWFGNVEITSDSFAARADAQRIACAMAKAIKEQRDESH